MNINNIIPEAIMYDILSRVPADILYNRLRPVCKLWSKIISDPIFIEQQLRRSEPGLIFQEITMRAGDQSLVRFLEVQWLQTRMMILDRGYGVLVKACCNGMLLLQDRQNSGIIYVTNPVTKQLVILPPCPSHEISSCGLAWLPSTGEYVVIYIFFNKMEQKMGFGLLTLGVFKWSWGHISYDEVPLWLKGRPVSVNGVVHWNLFVVPTIFSADVANKEPFRLTKLPSLTSKYGVFLQMGGFLSFVNWISPNFDVWLLKDFYQEKWEKQHSFTLQWLRDPIRIIPIGILKNGELIIFGGIDGSLYIYNVKLKKATKDRFRVNLTNTIYDGVNVNSLVFWGTNARHLTRNCFIQRHLGRLMVDGILPLQLSIKK